MSTKQMADLLGKTIRLDDRRTSAQYDAEVMDARTCYGKVQLQVNGDGVTWFEPTAKELESVR